MRPELANPAGQQFIQQAAQSQQTRRSLPESESIDRRLRQADDNVTYLRDRRNPAETRTDANRRSFERRDPRRADRRMGTTGSAFMAQMIAQEVLPQAAGRTPGFTQAGVATYDATVARAEAHIDPYNAYVVSA